MQRVHFQVQVGVFNCQQILTKISFVIFDTAEKTQIECGLAWHWWNSTDLGSIDMFLTNLNAEVVAYYSENRVTSLIFKVLDSLFARPGSAPIRGRKKGESRDWTIVNKALPKNYISSKFNENHDKLQLKRDSI